MTASLKPTDLNNARFFYLHFSEALECSTAEQLAWFVDSWQIKDVCCDGLLLQLPQGKREQVSLFNLTFMRFMPTENPN